MSRAGAEHAPVGSKRLRVLYIGVGNPIEPRSGMDRVCAHHLSELSSEPSFEVTAVVCVPGTHGQPAPGTYVANGTAISLHRGELHELASHRDETRAKLRMMTTRAVPLMAFSFYSRICAADVSRRLRRGGYDVLVVDHFYALANLDLRWLATQSAKVVYIAHDSMFALMNEFAAMRSSKIAAYAYRLEARRMMALESLLALRASCVIHLSEYERSQYRLRRSRRVALLPDLTRRVSEAAGARAPAYPPVALFVGATDHAPNADAIEWLLRELAPALASIAPEARVVLVGKGTDKLRALPTNVQAVGFVGDDTLAELMRACACVLSPVARGAGIKIKVLEAVAAGVPVLCSAESLRGLEPLELSPTIDLQAPLRVAQRIKELGESQEARDRATREVATAYQRFCDTRKGGLAKKLRELHGGERGS